MYDEYVHSKIYIYILCKRHMQCFTIDHGDHEFSLIHMCIYYVFIVPYAQAHRSFSIFIRNSKYRARQYIICLNHLRFNLLTVFITFAFHRLANFVLGWNNEKKKTQSTIFDKNHTHSLHFLRYLMELKERVCANVWWNISKQDLSCIMIKRILC